MQLKSKTIIGSRPGLHLLITGGVHGDEFEPMAAIRGLIRQLDAAEIRGKVTLVPVVNEAAFWHGQRAGSDGLDLARSCPGRADGSVTQQTADALSGLIRSADAYIDLHTGGTTMSVSPMSGYMLHPSKSVLEKQRQMARAFNLPTVWGTDYRLNGRSLSVARDAEIPAIYTEYHGGARCDPAGVQDYVEGCLNVISLLGLADRELPASKVKYFVEDDRQNSGHMQICNPAPRDGYYEPAVQLGDEIDVGQPLGTVCDILGDETVTVNSRQRGVVLTLRTFARVFKGDTLAVVMETNV